MFTTAQTDPRERRLALAYDYPTTEYSVGSLRLRPFSINAHRRAEVMGIVVVTHGFSVAREMLSPSQFQTDLDRLYWLLSAPLAEVQAAFRENRVESVSQPCSVPLPELARFAREVQTILDLCEAALFDVEPRKDASPDAEPPPPDQLLPTILSGTVTALCEKLHASEEWVAEWLPLCRALQYVHVIQFGNPEIWTIRKSAANAPDPYGEDIPDDEGVGVPVEF